MPKTEARGGGFTTIYPPPPYATGLNPLQYQEKRRKTSQALVHFSSAITYGLLQGFLSALSRISAGSQGTRTICTVRSFVPVPTTYAIFVWAFRQKAV